LIPFSLKYLAISIPTWNETSVEKGVAAEIAPHPSVIKYSGPKFMVFVRILEDGF